MTTKRRHPVATTHTDGNRITLVLVHGAWLSARSWENFAEYFGKRGFDVSAPEWPRKHGDVDESLGPLGRPQTCVDGPPEQRRRRDLLTRIAVEQGQLAVLEEPR